MYSDAQLAEYLLEIRCEVCSHCIERLPGGPPCRLLGKVCGIELNLPQIIDAVHARADKRIEPYVEEFHSHVCADCSNRFSDQCPCPLDSLQILVVQAVEAVDQGPADHHPLVTC
jgi:hypothetical protein